jgi:hypothetical protein
MQHSHEELRTAAFDVLSGRVPFAYQADHYAHLKIGVATALLERQGPIDQERQCGYPQDAALEPVLKSAFLWLADAPQHHANHRKVKHRRILYCPSCLESLPSHLTLKEAFVNAVTQTHNTRC